MILCELGKVECAEVAAFEIEVVHRVDPSVAVDIRIFKLYTSAEGAEYVAFEVKAVDHCNLTVPVHIAGHIRCNIKRFAILKLSAQGKLHGRFAVNYKINSLFIGEIKAVDISSVADNDIREGFQVGSISLGAAVYYGNEFMNVEYPRFLCGIAFG